MKDFIHFKKYHSVINCKRMSWVLHVIRTKEKTYKQRGLWENLKERGRLGKTCVNGNFCKNWIGGFDVLLTVHLSITLASDQLDAQFLYYIISLLHSSTDWASPG